MLDDIGWDVAIDGQGRVVVAALVGTSLGEAEATVAVLEPTFGETVWQRGFPGAVYNIEVQGGWLAIAENDDVILGTRTWSSETGFDLVLHRFDAADGAEVYHRQWNSGGTAADDPREMIQTADGDLVFAGVSGGDYLVARFDAEQGDFLWRGAYAGPPDWYDVATCVAEGPDGVLVASGFSDGTSTGWDVATVAFDPAEGFLLWEQRFDGYGQSDEARDVVVGPGGEVVVTGYCYSYESSNDLAAICYDTGGTVAAPDELPAGAVGLTGAWPNPFNPRVSISFAVPRDGTLRLSICDVRGRELAVLQDGVLPAGEHVLSWHGADAGGRALPSGLYFAVLRTEEGLSTRKLMLAR
jgi:outer membrane protein assembly factor BamB